MKRMLYRGTKILFAVIIIIGAYAAALCLVVRYSGVREPAMQASLIGASAALITGVLALLKDSILAAINAPSLRITFHPQDKRDCHKTSFTVTDGDTGTVKSAPTHYFRVRVENEGWSTADDVEVSLEEVRTCQNGKYEVDQNFMPLRLLWSHWKMKRPELSIPPGTYRHCDFAFIIDPNAPIPPLAPVENGRLLFWLDVFLRPNTGRTSLLPGKYQIMLCAFGKNAKRTSLTLQLEWKGVWDDDIDKMLTNCIIFD